MENIPVVESLDRRQTAAMTTTRAITDSAPAHHVPISIRVLRRLKPLVVALLASPLHGALSRDILLLRWTGRKTGKGYTLPISYVELNGRLYLCTRPEGSGWWRNVRAAREVEIRLRGETMTATATVLEPEASEALDGLRAFLTRNPGTGRLLYHVATDDRGKPREDDLEREVLASVVVRLDPERGAPVP
jgi:deazaflavin-dependent oxidoreductase (nitroreductase family)